MNQLPLVSIITPSFNQAQYLERTICSVLEQDYPNIEYIVMDGGSTDGSLKIIKNYADRLAYWCSESDEGQVAAINKGFALSNGEILGWINSDDFYEPGAIRTAAEYFINHPETSFLYGEGWYVDEYSQRLRICHFVKPNFRDFYLLNHDPTLQSATFWRRELWNKVGPLDSNINWVFDWEWYIRAHKKTTFQYIPEILSNYRIHPKAKTRTGGMDRQLEIASITLRYGHRWYPNYIIQMLRYTEYRWEQVTDWLPIPVQKIIRVPLQGIRFFFERIFHGYYRN
jgi:glycosyltransferase involved in cell wall biosynthesis